MTHTRSHLSLFVFRWNLFLQCFLTDDSLRVSDTSHWLLILWRVERLRLRDAFDETWRVFLLQLRLLFLMFRNHFRSWITLLCFRRNCWMKVYHISCCHLWVLLWLAFLRCRIRFVNVIQVHCIFILFRWYLSIHLLFGRLSNLKMRSMQCWMTWSMIPHFRIGLALCKVRRWNHIIELDDVLKSSYFLVWKAFTPFSFVIFLVCGFQNFDSLATHALSLAISRW